MFNPVLIKSFLKGLNQSLDSQLIQPDEATIAENVDVRKGTLKRVKGSIQYAALSPANAIKGLMKYFNGSSSVLITTGNGSLYKLNGTNYQLISSGFHSDNYDYVNYQSGVNQIMIFANGTDNVKVYDGVTLRDLKHDGAASADSSTNKAPVGSLIEVHKERLFISGDNTAPNRLYFSKSFDPEDFTAPTQADTANTRGGFIDIPTFDEGSSIIALKSLFDQLMIFKKKNVFRLYGTYQGNFQVVQVFNTVNGELIDKTIAAAENKAIWSTTEGLFWFDSVNLTDLTPMIKDIFSSLNQAYIKNAVGILFKNTYYLAVPSAGNSVNDTVIEYDLTTKSFTVRKGMIVTSFTDFNGELLFSSSDGKIYKYNNGNDYVGQAINSTWKSGRITLGRLDKKKFLQNISFIGSGNGSIRLSVTNGKDISTADISLDSLVRGYKVRLKCKGYYLIYTINNLNGCDFEISQMQLNIEVPI